MASALRVSKTSSSSSLFSRFTSNTFLVRNFSSATTTTTPAAATDAEAIKKPKRKKKKNFFEVAQFLPNWGVGYQLAKSHWNGVSYQITKINLYKDGRHGKAWGIVHKEGVQAADAPKKISGVHKRCWKYIPNSYKAESNIPKMIKAEESIPKPELENV